MGEEEGGGVYFFTRYIVPRKGIKQRLQIPEQAQNRYNISAPKIFYKCKNTHKIRVTLHLKCKNTPPPSPISATRCAHVVFNCLDVAQCFTDRLTVLVLRFQVHDICLLTHAVFHRYIDCSFLVLRLKVHDTGSLTHVNKESWGRLHVLDKIQQRPDSRLCCITVVAAEGARGSLSSVGQERIRLVQL